MRWNSKKEFVDAVWFLHKITHFQNYSTDSKLSSIKYLVNSYTANHEEKALYNLYFPDCFRIFKLKN
jgi:hypothetical protein